MTVKIGEKPTLLPPSAKRRRIEEEECCIAKLPPELLFYIFEFLPFSIKVNAGKVAKNWCAIVLNSREYRFKKSLMQKFGRGWDRALFYFSPLIEERKTTWEDILGRANSSLLDFFDTITESLVCQRGVFGERQSDYKVYGEWHFSYCEDNKSITIKNVLTHEVSTITFESPILCYTMDGNCLYAILRDKKSSILTFKKWNYKKHCLLDSKQVKFRHCNRELCCTHSFFSNGNFYFNFNNAYFARFCFTSGTFEFYSEISVSCVDKFLLDQNILYVATGSCVEIWDLESKKKLHEVEFFPFHRTTMCEGLYKEGNKLIVCSSNGKLFSVDAESYDSPHLTLPLFDAFEKFCATAYVNNTLIVARRRVTLTSSVIDILKIEEDGFAKEIILDALNEKALNFRPETLVSILQAISPSPTTLDPDYY